MRVFKGKIFVFNFHCHFTIWSARIMLEDSSKIDVVSEKLFGSEPFIGRKENLFLPYIFLTHILSLSLPLILPLTYHWYV